MKLEVGMHVRTKEGNIEKICAIENEHIYTNEDYLSWYPSSNAISKASHNIIDLIEVGDYVNGKKVERIDKDPFIKGQVNLWTNDIISNYWGDISLSPIRDKEVKSIVTREQFKSMEYKVGE